MRPVSDLWNNHEEKRKFSDTTSPFVIREIVSTIILFYESAR